MNLNKQLLAACVAGICAVSAAQAQVAGTGLYVGGSIGQSKWKGGDFDVSDRNKVGGKAARQAAAHWVCRSPSDRVLRC